MNINISHDILIPMSKSIEEEIEKLRNKKRI